ncbi:hypothetical protein K0M31_010701 [Melipona bicolor]|uniref:Uncharacterized protein n=1 Tax=Melipona bicolor TaxID=60889 RepID=A0AA40KHV8_9HYME|nr:hypothetical protein K0M31_010701 [Melipona bicolor]
MPVGSVAVWRLWFHGGHQTVVGPPPRPCTPAHPHTRIPPPRSAGMPTRVDFLQINRRPQGGPPVAIGG